MKIKILKINQRLQDLTGTSQKGFPYVIVQWNCDIEINGQQIYQALVKTMQKNFNLELQEYEADVQTYNGIQSYMIKKEKSGFSEYKKPTYTKDEYDRLFDYALNKCQIKPLSLSEDNKCKIFATYFIGAKDSGVKI